jgi:hypothetical protein
MRCKIFLDNGVISLGRRFLAKPTAAFAGEQKPATYFPTPADFLLTLRFMAGLKEQN